jgi:hypothetical protein
MAKAKRVGERNGDKKSSSASSSSKRDIKNIGINFRLMTRI